MSLLPALALAAAFAAPPAAPPDLSTAPWANVPAPLSLSQLRGRPVLLEFSDPWSDESARALRWARAAQSAFPDSAVLVSVRTPRAGEDNGAAALSAEALRDGLSTPLVEDATGRLAWTYGVERRPAAVLLDAKGRFSRRFEYLEMEKDLAPALAKLVDAARAEHELWTSTGPAAPAWDAYAEGPLLAPTGLAYDEALDRLAIADTGHDRVVLADSSGRVKVVAGYGVPGYRDGAPELASFARPVALAFTGTQVGVADSGNDYIRVIDLAKKPLVSSWFGSANYFHWPASLLIEGKSAFFGSPIDHTIWAVDLAQNRRYRFFGNGSAGDRDGLPAVATVREPRALAVVDGTLYAAEAVSGRLRASSLDTPDLKTLALKGPGAPLRHPLALAAQGKLLLIADAGDGSLKRLDPATNEVTVLASGLKRPSGLAVVKGRLVVAEADASRLSRFDADGKPLGELKLKGLEIPQRGPLPPPLPPRGKTMESPALQTVRAGTRDDIEVDVELPEGLILNPRAPMTVRYVETVGKVKVPPDSRRSFSLPPRPSAKLSFVPEEGPVSLILDVDFFYCRADRKGLCYASSRRYQVDLNAVKTSRERSARFVARP